MSTTSSTRHNPATSPVDARGLLIWKVCAWCGPIYIVGVLLCFAGIAGFLPPPREYWSSGEVASFYLDNEVRIRLGMEGVIFFAFFYLPWSLAVARLMERVEGSPRMLSRIQLYGGLGTALITVACGVAWLTASFRAGERSPGEIALMNDLGFMIFALTIIVTVFQVVSFGALWLMDLSQQLVPRWVGYLSLWAAVIVLPVFLIPSLQSGPFAWHGLFNFYIGLAAFGGWILLASWATLRALSSIKADTEAA